MLNERNGRGVLGLLGVCGLAASVACPECGNPPDEMAMNRVDAGRIAPGEQIEVRATVVLSPAFRARLAGHGAEVTVGAMLRWSDPVACRFSGDTTYTVSPSDENTRVLRVEPADAGSGGDAGQPCYRLANPVHDIWVPMHDGRTAVSAILSLNQFCPPGPCVNTIRVVVRDDGTLPASVERPNIVFGGHIDYYGVPGGPPSDGDVRTTLEVERSGP